MTPVEGFNARRRLRQLSTCRHFSGIQHATCAAGVAIATVKDSAPGRPNRWPCCPSIDGGEPATSCASRDLLTEADIAAQEAAITEFLRKQRLGICACGVEGTDWVQVDCCIYAEPCGHRVGQGDARDYKAGVLAARAAGGTP